ncbi:Signal peptidase complex subunit 2 [Cichlidogyrus casuarinus]|uniref:Signal peptidase complex subunit 2 n=1 Tax=Cichlidogyrus casuarinus TaxID=1844966 RepID=A0ABD2Q3J3_9PLAT
MAADGEIKVDKLNSSAVKNALDDAIKKICKDSFYLDEKFSLINCRLLIATISVLFAGFGCLWDYLHPFPNSKAVLIVCAVFYFIFSGIFTLYMLFIEKQIFFVGIETKAGSPPKKIKWQISSDQSKYSANYKLTIVKTTNGKHNEYCKSLYVGDYFDTKGYLCQDKLKRDFEKFCDSAEGKKQS